MIRHRARGVLLAMAAALLAVVATASPAAADHGQATRAFVGVHAQSTDVATEEPFVPTGEPSRLSHETQQRWWMAIGAFLLVGAVLAVSMIRGGPLGMRWYYGGKSLNELDARPPLFSFHDNYRTRRRR